MDLSDLPLQQGFQNKPAELLSKLLIQCGRIHQEIIHDIHFFQCLFGFTHTSYLLWRYRKYRYPLLFCLLPPT